MKFSLAIVASLAFSFTSVQASWFGFSTETKADKSVVEKIENVYDTCKSYKNYNNIKNAHFDKLKSNVQDAVFKGHTWFSEFNVIPLEKEYFLYMDAPGMNFKEIHVSTDEETIIVEGKHVCDKSEKVCISREIDASLTMPRDADMSSIETMYRKGVVFIRVYRHNSFSRKKIELVDKWSDFKDKISEKYEEVKKNVQNVADNIVSQVLESQEKVVENVEKVVDSVKDDSSKNYKKVKNNAESVVDNVKKESNKNYNNIKENVKEKIEMISETVEQYRNEF